MQKTLSLRTNSHQINGFDNKPIGINTLCSTVSRLCNLAGITEENFRNQSLQASSLTRMHQAHVLEQAIKEFSGHRSNAMRVYKRSSEDMKRENCKIIREANVLKPKNVPTCTVSKPEFSDSDFEVDVSKKDVDKKCPSSASKQKIESQ